MVGHPIADGKAVPAGEIASANDRAGGDVLWAGSAQPHCGNLSRRDSREVCHGVDGPAHAAGGIFRAARDMRRLGVKCQGSPGAIDQRHLDIRAPQIDAGKKRTLRASGGQPVGAVVHGMDFEKRVPLPSGERV